MILSVTLSPAPREVVRVLAVWGWSGPERINILEETYTHDIHRAGDTILDLMMILNDLIFAQNKIKLTKLKPFRFEI